MTSDLTSAASARGFAAADVVGSLGAAESFGDVLESPPRKSRRTLTTVLVSGAVTLALLAGGGAYALVRLWNGPAGALPEDAMPGSVAAFARINLTPGLSQRVKFESLLLKAEGGGPKSLDGVKRDAFKDMDAPIGYDDVAPWFDDRIGYGLWSDAKHGNKPVGLLAVSYTDKEKARKALTAAQQKAGTDKVGFVIGDNYALVALGSKDLQASAEAAAAAAKESPLSKEWAFTTAIAKLPPDQPGIGFADLSSAMSLQSLFIGRALNMAEDSGDFPPDAGPGLDPTADPAFASPFKGTLAVGVQAADKGIEVHARITGAAGLPLLSTTSTIDALTQLGTVRDDATAAAVVSGPLGDTTMFGGGFALASILMPAAMLGGEEDSYTEPSLPPNINPADDEAVAKYFEQHPELFQSPPMSKPLAAFTKNVSDAKSFTFVSAGKASHPGDPSPGQVDLDLKDEAAAKQLQSDLTDLLKRSKVTCEVRANHAVLTSVGYPTAGNSGKLADSALFRDAMLPAVPNATVAFYVDGKRSDSGPAKAIGITVGHEGQDLTLTARIIL